MKFHDDGYASKNDIEKQLPIYSGVVVTNLLLISSMQIFLADLQLTFGNPATDLRDPVQNTGEYLCPSIRTSALTSVHPPPRAPAPFTPGCTAGKRVPLTIIGPGLYISVTARNNLPLYHQGEPSTLPNPLQLPSTLSLPTSCFLYFQNQSPVLIEPNYIVIRF